MSAAPPEPQSSVVEETFRVLDHLEVAKRRALRISLDGTVVTIDYLDEGDVVLRWEQDEDDPNRPGHGFVVHVKHVAIYRAPLA